MFFQENKHYFIKRGKLSKEDKLSILERFGLEVKNNKSSTTNMRRIEDEKVIIFYKKSRIGLLGMRESYFLNHGKLCSMADTYFVVLQNNVEVKLSKHMYDYKIVPSEEYSKSLKEINSLLEDMKRIMEEFHESTNKVRNFFEEK